MASLAECCAWYADCWGVGGEADVLPGWRAGAARVVALRCHGGPAYAPLCVNLIFLRGGGVAAAAGRPGRRAPGPDARGAVRDFPELLLEVAPGLEEALGFLARELAGAEADFVPYVLDFSLFLCGAPCRRPFLAGLGVDAGALSAAAAELGLRERHRGAYPRRLQAWRRAAAPGWRGLRRAWAGAVARAAGAARAAPGPLLSR